MCDLQQGRQELIQKANKRLKSVINQSKALILASHSPDLITNNCNRVIALDHGQIVFDGNPEEFYKTPEI